jgi:hypothetical protein
MRDAQTAREETELGHSIDTPADQVNQLIKESTTQPTTQAAAPTTQTAHIHKTLLEADPQLAAALLVVRLELTGAHL